MAVRAALILGLVLLGFFAWRAWRPMPNLALLVAILAGIGSLFVLRSPYALALSGLLAIACFWVIRNNRG
jgi:hypothetical protein